MNDLFVDQKVLTETFTRFVSRHGLTSGLCQMDSKIDSRVQTAVSCLAGARKVKCGAVIYRGANNRQAEGNVY